MTRRIAVAAPAREAADAAIAVGEAGGNAVDAAIAAVAVASVTEVGIVSPMGGAFVNIWAPGQEPIVIDGNVEMPGRARPADRFGAGVSSYFMDYFGGFTVHGGHGSVATPGMFAALETAGERWGRLPWQEVLAPAVHVARTGWPLGVAAEFYLRHSGPTLFHWHHQTREFLDQNGSGGRPALGEVLRSPDLAASLEAIARDGVDTLYTGELAHLIAADMDTHDGLLGLADLAAYRSVIRPVLRTHLDGWDVAANPAPSIGGPVLTAMLRILAGHHDELGEEDARDIIDIQHTVLDYRRHAIDAAEDLERAGFELLQALAELGPAGLAGLSSSPDTIHVSTTDDEGLACSITTSAGYGSGVTVPGTGLMLNNALGEPELNRRGLHALPPGTRLASNMAPTTARHTDGRVLAIGSPGADRITTALLQVIGGICLEGLGLQVAIDEPRLHVAYDGSGTPRVEYEADPDLLAAVEASGMASVEHSSRSMFFGGVGATLRHADGSLEAAGDPRREAATRVS
ncbi:MAG: gamma-glutamyltransferase [Mobilicoccus sp.]|nr:gamma-glutamyltransferase [Mobilicoccus sp.]